MATFSELLTERGLTPEEIEQALTELQQVVFEQLAAELFERLPPEEIAAIEAAAKSERISMTVGAILACIPELERHETERMILNRVTVAYLSYIDTHAPNR
jgi:L-asparagine transporter-like permease